MNHQNVARAMGQQNQQTAQSSHEHDERDCRISIRVTALETAMRLNVAADVPNLLAAAREIEAYLSAP